MSTTIERIGDAYADTFPGSICGLWTFIAGYGVAFFRGPMLTLVMCAGLPLIMATQAWSTMMVRLVQRESQGHYAQAAEVVEESLYAIKTIVSLGLERESTERFTAAMEMVRRGGVRLGFKKGVAFASGWFCMLMSFALCFWYGSRLIYDDTKHKITGKPYTGADVLAVFMCTFTGSVQAANIDAGIRQFFSGCNAAATVFNLVETPITIHCAGKDSRRTLMNVETMAFEDVHFAYPARMESPILTGVNLEIRMGQKVAFVGASGCGKSTSIALLERFYDPIQGRVLVNGEDLRLFSIKSVRSIIGYVGQEPVLFSGTIRDNVLNGNPTSSNTEVERVIRQADCSFLSNFPDGLDTDGGMGGSQLSGGQKQRIAIARALLRRPSVLLLDEATSALDNKSEKNILETFDSLITESSGTLSTVNVAHRLSSIRNCNCIFMYVLGKVAEKGSFRELMALHGHFYALAESQTYTDVDIDISDDEEEEETLPEEKQAKIEGLKKVGSRISDVPKTSVRVRDEESRALGTVHEEEVEAAPKIPLKRILSYGREKMWVMPLILLSAMCNGATFPFIGLLQIEAAFDYAIPDKEEMLREIPKVWGGYIICALNLFTALCCVGLTVAMMSETMIKNIRVALLKNLLRQEVGFHDNPVNSAAALGYALQVDTYRVSSQLEQLPVNMGVIGSLSLGIILGAYFEWRILLTMLVFIPIIIGSTITMVLLQAGVNAGTIPESAKAIISESVQNPKTLQALTLEKNFIEKYVSILAREDDTEWQRFKSLIPSSFFSGLSNAMIAFLIGTNVWIIGFLVKEEVTENAGCLRSFVSTLWGAQGAGFVAVTLGDMAKVSKAVSNIFRLIDTKSAIDGIEPDGEMPPPDFQPGTIEFKRVVFAYPFRPSVQILKGMSFTVQAGQSVGLVGPSGGGKSTIYALIQRFYDPLNGQVLVGPQKLDLKLINIRYWRGVIGFVGQEPVLFNTTVRQNIVYGARENTEVTQDMLDKSVEVANLGFIFEKNGAGFETEVGPKGSRLSGGQKQRVAIARAFIRDPQILLLDEATSALDLASEHIVSEALEKTRIGRTSFSIAHRLSTVEDCDIIFVAGEGLILEQGSDAELMTKQGLYTKLQSLQGRDNMCCA